MSWISQTVSVRLLSGDILKIEVPTHITNSKFYHLVFDALPEEIRPTHCCMCQMVLFEKDVIPNTKELFVPSDEVFSLYLDHHDYDVQLFPTPCDIFDIAQEPAVPYDGLCVSIVRQSRSETVPVLEHDDSFYIKKENEREHQIRNGTDVPFEIGGRWGEEMTIQIPADSPVYSLEEMFDVILRRLEQKMDLSVYAAECIKSRLLEKYQTIMEPWREDEAYEANEENWDDAPDWNVED
jgi:hypothetical protein